MSNLPHPLGDAIAGELFFPGAPTVIVADAPSANGSRAVDFGEDGLSSSVNRMGYALGKNEEYIQARMEQEIARPDLVTFTPAAGNGGNYTFAAKVWCGDADYLPEDQSIRNGLIGVLDDKYNDMVDSVSGDLIVVKEILDAPAGVTQVGLGFITNPYITFRKVHPVTGALGGDFTIPDGVKTWLAFGISGSLDALVGAGSGGMQDAWFRGFTRSIGEIHASSFLKDGSRRATGDFNMDGNSIVDVMGVWSYANIPLTIGGQGGVAAHVNLISNNGVVRFKDQHLAAYLPLNDAATALAGDHTSVLTSLNSKTAVAQAYFGNRSLDRVGVFTFTDLTGQFDWPELNVVIDGEQRTIAAGNYIATNHAVTIFVAVVTSIGTVVERNPLALESTDIPLAAHTWNGAAFTRKVDIRWAYNGTSRHLEITCGNAYTCDFSGAELDQAVELTCRLGDAARHNRAHLPTLRIVHAAFAPSTAPFKITLTAPIAIVGNGVEFSRIMSDGVNGHTVDFIDCAGHRIVVKDLTIMHSGNVQATTLGAFKNAGDGSIFQNLKFTKDPGTFDKGFSNPFIWTSTAEHVLIDNVETEGTQHAFVMGSDPTLATAYLTESRIRDCRLTWEGTPLYGCVVNGAGNIVENVIFASGLDKYCIVGGHDMLIDHCKMQMVGAAGPNVAGIFYKPLAAGSFPLGLRVRDCFFFQMGGGGIRVESINDPGMLVRILVQACEFEQVNLPFVFDTFVAVHANSSIIVDGCTTDVTTEFVASVNCGSVNCIQNVKFNNNVCNAVGGAGFVIGDKSVADITNNFIEGYGAIGALNDAIDIAADGIGDLPRCEIFGNVIGTVGAPATSNMVHLRRPCNFTDNKLVGGIIVDCIGLFLDLFADCIVSGNRFCEQTKAAIWVAAGANGCQISNNLIEDIPEDSFGVYVDAATNTMITANRFTGVLFIGKPILVLDGGIPVGGECTQITGNQFWDTEGHAGGTFSIVEISVSGGGAKNCLINNNEFDSCGSENPVLNGTFQALIRAEGEQTQIHDNHIRKLTGVGGGDFSFGIRLTNEGSVLGNTVFHDFDNDQAASTMVAIDIDVGPIHGPIICSNNSIDFRGTSALGAGKTTIGIDLNASDNVSCMGNVVNDWTHVGAVANWGFFALAAGNNIYVGNHSIVPSNIAPAKPAGGGLRTDFNSGVGF